MDYSIDHLILVAWVWLYPRDLAQLIVFSAIGYLTFFHAFAYGYQSLLRVSLFGLSLFAVIAMWLYFRDGAAAFFIPNGSFFSIAWEFTYLIAAVVLSRLTARPLVSLWFNMGDALPPIPVGDDHFTPIDRLKRFAAHLNRFVLFFLVLPLFLLAMPKSVISRFKSAKLDATVRINEQIEKSRREKRRLAWKNPAYRKKFIVGLSTAILLFSIPAATIYNMHYPESLNSVIDILSKGPAAAFLSSFGPRGANAGLYERVFPFVLGSVLIAFVVAVANHAAMRQYGKSLYSLLTEYQQNALDKNLKSNDEFLPAVISAPSGKPSVAGAIQLKLKRSQRTNTFGTLFYMLDARMAVSNEDHSLIQRYKLADTVVYDSKNRQQYSEAAKGHLESTREQASLLDTPKNQLVGAAKTFYRLGRASLSTALAALSLRITVSSLLKGVHIECKSMGELLEGEDAIVTAARNVKQYLETAATFDGREEILEF
jgi:hypothetical protein